MYFTLVQYLWKAQVCRRAFTMLGATPEALNNMALVTFLLSCLLLLHTYHKETALSLHCCHLPLEVSTSRKAATSKVCCWEVSMERALVLSFCSSVTSQLCPCSQQTRSLSTIILYRPHPLPCISGKLCRQALIKDHLSSSYPITSNN